MVAAIVSGHFPKEHRSLSESIGLSNNHSPNEPKKKKNGIYLPNLNDLMIFTPL